MLKSLKQEKVDLVILNNVGYAQLKNVLRVYRDVLKLNVGDMHFILMSYIPSHFISHLLKSSTSLQSMDGEKSASSPSDDVDWHLSSDCILAAKSRSGSNGNYNNNNSTTLSSLSLESSLFIRSSNFLFFSKHHFNEEYHGQPTYPPNGEKSTLQVKVFRDIAQTLIHFQMSRRRRRVNVEERRKSSLNNFKRDEVNSNMCDIHFSLWTLIHKTTKIFDSLILLKELLLTTSSSTSTSTSSTHDDEERRRSSTSMGHSCSLHSFNSMKVDENYSPSNDSLEMTRFTQTNMKHIKAYSFLSNDWIHFNRNSDNGVLSASEENERSMQLVQYSGTLGRYLGHSNLISVIGKWSKRYNETLFNSELNFFSSAIQQGKEENNGDECNHLLSPLIMFNEKMSDHLGEDGGDLFDKMKKMKKGEKVILKVVTKLERPYVMKREGVVGNDAFFGFAIDMWKAIAKHVDIEYEIYTVPDNFYGFFNQKSNAWNGIVKQLMDREADIALASITINHARHQVIDFTKPFMNLGISVMFKAPDVPKAELFSFMNPLQKEIWIYILVAYVMVSITIWIVARFSPYEWHPPSRCVDANSLFYQNDFTLPNSFWFAIGTLMQQGSDLNPKAASTRIVGGLWWFFSLIIISSYTANLAAFLTVERMTTPIASADDLVEQSQIQYGTLAGGSTMTFFRDSRLQIYQKMWRHMEQSGTFVASYEEGVKKVLAGNFAFLCESTMLEYLVQRNCNLTQIGGLLDTKGYGIGTPKRSKWKSQISKAILYLQEKGIIQLYYDKWWKTHSNQNYTTNFDDKVDVNENPMAALTDINDVSDGGETNTCPSSTRKGIQDKIERANALGYVNIGGVFVVLTVGLAFALLVSILEFLTFKYRRRRQDQHINRSQLELKSDWLKNEKTAKCLAIERAMGGVKTSVGFDGQSYKSATIVSTGMQLNDKSKSCSIKREVR